MLNVSFIIKRLLKSILVLVAVTLLVAFLIRFTGDPAVMMLSNSGSVTEEDLQHIRHSLGTDQPFLIQYVHFMQGLISGDPGVSFFRGPIGPLIATALPATLLLAVSSLVVSLIISIPLGVYAATHKGQWSDQLIRIISLTGLSFPNFWLGLMMVLLFAVTLQWLPPSGFNGLPSLLMPTLTISIILTATNLRIVRTTMLEVLSEPYIMVSRAKGLPEHKVIYKHALRNSSIALVTYLGLQFGTLVGGLVVIEQVFGWPGIGTLAVDAIAQRDYPILQACISILAIVIVTANLLVDLTYSLLDPRIRME